MKEKKVYVPQYVIDIIENDQKELVDTIIDYLNKDEFNTVVIHDNKKVTYSFESLVQHLLAKHNQALISKDALITLLKNTVQTFRVAIRSMVKDIFEVDKYDIRVDYISDVDGEYVNHRAIYTIKLEYFIKNEENIKIFGNKHVSFGITIQTSGDIL